MPIHHSFAGLPSQQQSGTREYQTHSYQLWDVSNPEGWEVAP
jgi:hypothetical protein